MKIVILDYFFMEMVYNHPKCTYFNNVFTKFQPAYYSENLIINSVTSKFIIKEEGFSVPPP